MEFWVLIFFCYRFYWKLFVSSVINYFWFQKIFGRVVFDFGI